MDEVLEAVRGAADVPGKLREVLTDDAWWRLLNALRQKKHFDRPKKNGRQPEPAHQSGGQSKETGSAEEVIGLVHFEAWVTPEQAEAMWAYLQRGEPLPVNREAKVTAHDLSPESV